MTQRSRGPSVSGLRNFEPPSKEVAEAHRKAFDAKVSDDPDFKLALKERDRLAGARGSEDTPAEMVSKVVARPEIEGAPADDAAATALIANPNDDASPLGSTAVREDGDANEGPANGGGRVGLDTEPSRTTTGASRRAAIQKAARQSWLILGAAGVLLVGFIALFVWSISKNDGAQTTQNATATNTSAPTATAKATATATATSTAATSAPVPTETETASETATPPSATAEPRNTDASAKPNKTSRSATAKASTAAPTTTSAKPSTSFDPEKWDFQKGN
ncbi:MAG: hypothetical protein HOW73_39075 [Polyangiaceae bacterium]|nr:hypothetical protein [Polyangiaceae bacterium]